jgi:hypothetical protein
MSARSYNGGGRQGGQAFGGGGNVQRFRGGDGQAYRSHRGGHRHAHRSRGRYLLYAAPIGAYGYYAYGDGCEWLRQRAHYSGSAYWWDRYNSCVYGYRY